MKTLTRIFTILALLAFAVPGFGQTAADLCGKWSNTQTEKDDDSEFTMTGEIVFNEDGSFTETGYATILFNLDDDSKFNCDLVFSAKGTYTVTDGVICYVFDPKSANVKEGKNEFPAILKALLINPLKSELKKSLKKPSRDRIVSFSPQKMTVIDPDDKDAEEEVYTKVQ